MGVEGADKPWHQLSEVETLRRQLALAKQTIDSQRAYADEVVRLVEEKRIFREFYEANEMYNRAQRAYADVSVCDTGALDGARRIMRESLDDLERKRGAARMMIGEIKCCNDSERLVPDGDGCLKCGKCGYRYRYRRTDPPPVDPVICYRPTGVDTLKSLSDEELAKIPPLNPREIEWALEKGRRERDLMFPRPGANIGQLQHDYASWLANNPPPSRAQQRCIEGAGFNLQTVAGWVVDGAIECEPKSSEWVRVLRSVVDDLYKQLRQEPGKPRAPWHAAGHGPGDYACQVRSGYCNFGSCAPQKQGPDR